MRHLWIALLAWGAATLGGPAQATMCIPGFISTEVGEYGVPPFPGQEGYLPEPYARFIWAHYDANPYKSGEISRGALLIGELTPQWNEDFPRIYELFQDAIETQRKSAVKHHSDDPYFAWDFEVEFRIRGALRFSGIELSAEGRTLHQDEPVDLLLEFREAGFDLLPLGEPANRIFPVQRSEDGRLARRVYPCLRSMAAPDEEVLPFLQACFENGGCDGVDSR